MIVNTKIRILSVVLLIVEAVVLVGSDQLKIEITHWNDVSAQLESFQKGTFDSSSAPKPCPTGGSSNCVGGAVSLVHHVYTNISDTEYQLRISSGNLIGGESGWISVIGWENYGKYITENLKPDVVAFGMKEFGAGVNQANTFVKALGAEKMVLANTCEGSAEGEAEAKFCSTLARFKAVTFGSHTIGVIGFLNPTVEQLSLPGKLKFTNVVEAIKKFVASSDIKTFIAAGDGNLNLAKEICDKVPQVKLVVYGAGFSNTNINTYPLIYNNGKVIATAGRYGSSIGKLVVNWNTETGNLVPDLSSKIINTVAVNDWNDQAKKASSELTKLRAEVDKQAKEIIGHTRVKLEGGEKCWRDECNLGNLMTDAMVHCALVPADQHYPFHIHAIWHGGAFFEDAVVPGARISQLDVHKWLPYHNKAHLVKTSGANLKKLFEKSASGIDPKKANEKDWRQFLQVSNGMEIYYSTKSGVPKLERIRMTHDNDGTPKMGDLDTTTTYYLVIPTYLFEGRGVYDFAKGFWTTVDDQPGVPSNLGFDDECLEGYIRALNQVSVGLEERIWIDEEPSGSGSGGCHKCNTAVTVVLTIVFFSIFLAVIYVGYFYVLPRLRRQPVEYPPNQL